MISNASEILRDDDYPSNPMSSRQQKHRIHYSRIKSAAIAASYRLMHVSTDNVLVRMTANAAVNGMRPEYVKAAEEHKQQVEPDIVEDDMYNHKQEMDPIVDLCLIKEPRRNKDVLSLSSNPFPCEFAIYFIFQSNPARPTFNDPLSIFRNLNLHQITSSFYYRH